MDPHSPALVNALLSADLFGVAPADVLLVGIRAESYEAGCTLSKPVKASLEQAIAEVLRELDRLGVEYRCQEHPPELDIWWTTVTCHTLLSNNPDTKRLALLRRSSPSIGLTV